MAFNTFGESSTESLKPQVTSTDAEERKLARRLRILRRQSAVKKRQLAELKFAEDEEEIRRVSSNISKTPLEVQVSTCNDNMFDAIDEGIEAVTNIQVAGNAHEVQRREDEAITRAARIAHLEEEAQIANDKFNAINAKWEKISKLNDPLDLFQETEKQKEKCKELIALKDGVILKLQDELKMADLRFLKDQDKQTAEINLLVQRINEQIKIIKRVLRTQLDIIENAIDAERNEIIEAFNKKWEASNRQREKEQVNNLDQKLRSLEEHHEEMDRIMINHQERYREAKISLEKDIQLLQRELESMKAVCLMNKEKIDYNYQVLKKRDEENLLIKSQQKRRINKLQDIATTLRRQINEMAKNSQSEIRRLRADVVNLYKKITDIEQKSKHFMSVNDVKFNQVWKFNTEQANSLLTKILAMDRVIYEQVLGIDWFLPEEYLKYLDDAQRKSFDQSVDDHTDRKLSIYKMEDKYEDKEEASLSSEEATLREKQQCLVRHLLSIIADSSGFLVEERLQELLAPYSRPQKTLVYLHNIFSALDVKNLQDIDILTNILDPYIDCLTCAKRVASAKGEGKVLTEVSSGEIGPNLKQKRDSGILAQIADIVSEHKLMIHDVVRDMTVQGRGSDYIGGGPEEDSLSFEDLDDELNEISELDDQSTNTKILLNVKSEEEVRLSGVSTPPSFIVGDAQPRSDSLQSRHSEQKKSDTEIIPAEDEAKKEAPSPAARLYCRNPTHTLVVEPVLVMKALRLFVAEINDLERSEIPLTLKEKLQLEQKAAEKKFSKEDVSNFWDGYRTIFASKQEKLWDALLLGLHKYHDILQNRHVLNMEIHQLKIQNHDLRRLLQHYTIPPKVKKDTSTDDEDFFPAIQSDEIDIKPDPTIELLKPSKRSTT